MSLPIMTPAVPALLLGLMLMAAPIAVTAQTAAVPFGRSAADAGQPVEITADRLELDQATGIAAFTGTVRAGQGALRLAADRMQVHYRDGGKEGAAGASAGAIDRIVADGNVTLSNGTEAAEAAHADYDVATGIVEMAGAVLLTQGRNTLASDRLRIDLVSGAGVLEGRVQTVFTPGTTATGASR